MDDTHKQEEAIELGSWLGRRQAFNGIGGRCSAADAVCLARMKKDQMHKRVGLTWEEFCTKRIGVSRSLADKTIRLLEEFGETYFQLNGTTPIAPDDYRQIAAAVSPKGIQVGDEVIPIAPQNSAALASAIDSLKQRSVRALPAPAKPEPVSVRKPLKKLLDTLDELEKLMAGGVSWNDHALARTLLRGSLERLNRLDCNLRVSGRDEAKQSA